MYAEDRAMRRPFRGEMPFVLTLPLGPLGLERKRRARTQRRRRRAAALFVTVAVALAALALSV
jgi:hypothetical protein